MNAAITGRDSALIYAENRLAPWAKWAKEHREALGFPTISLLYKAMRQKAVQLKACPQGITANGSQTLSFRPLEVGEIPVAIAEVDHVVAGLPTDLHTVIVADYFTYGPIEVRCQATRWRRARYSQLLESAKYAVFVSLASRRESGG
jgi:hypothetical protein